MRPADAIAMHTGYALFDRNDALIDANAEILAGGLVPGDLAPGTGVVDVVGRVLEQLRSFDGHVVESDAAFSQQAAERWRRGDGAPVEAQTLDGCWKLLAAHPRTDGGLALGQPRHHRDQARPDRTSGERPRSSAASPKATPCRSGSSTRKASRSSTRAWTPPTCSAASGGRTRRNTSPPIPSMPMISSRSRALAGKHEIVRDHDIQLQAGQWRDRSGVRPTAGAASIAAAPSLVIGVLDITERKQREDLFGFLIKHHPLAGLDERRQQRRSHLPQRGCQAAVRLGRQARPDAPSGSPTTSSTANNIWRSAAN